MKAKTNAKPKTAKAKAKPQPKATTSQTAMDKFKFEVANELGIPLKQGYNGDLTSKQTGYVGGYMVNIVSPEQHINEKPILQAFHKFFTRRKGMRNVPAVRVGYTYILSLG